MGKEMALRRILVRLLESVINGLEHLVERLEWQNEMRLWEIENNTEGFPKEWFEDGE